MKIFVILALTTTLFHVITGFTPTPTFVGSRQVVTMRTTQNWRMASSTGHNESDEKKTILITGSSQGLGQAIAYEMAKNGGHNIVVNYIAGCEEGAKETVQQVQQLGGNAVAIQADCTDPKQVKEMFQKAIEHFGKVDVLVNNAGVTRDNLVPRMKPQVNDWIRYFF